MAGSWSQTTWSTVKTKRAITHWDEPPMADLCM